MTSILTLFLNSLRVLRALRGFIFINRRVRRDRKDFCNGIQLKAITYYPLDYSFSISSLLRPVIRQISDTG